MCFVSNAEWFAEVYEHSDPVATRPTVCDECCCPIPVGTTYHRIEMQEYEQCRACLDGDCECPRDADGDCAECKCEKPSLGESHTYERCTGCHLFLQAVEEAEKEAGCKAHESRPDLDCMIESLSEGDERELLRYFKKATVMHPELRESGYLAILWRKII